MSAAPSPALAMSDGQRESLEVLARAQSAPHRQVQRALGCPAFSGLQISRPFTRRAVNSGTRCGLRVVSGSRVRNEFVDDCRTVRCSAQYPPCRFLSGRIHHVMDSFVLQAGEKRFRERIVPTLTGPPDRMPQPKLDQFLPVFGRRVLRAAVGMHNAIRFEPAVAHRPCPPRRRPARCACGRPSHSRSPRGVQQSISDAKYSQPCHVRM